MVRASEGLEQLVSSCQRKLMERRLRSGPSQPAPVPVLPAFSCDQCDAVYGKLRALRSHQMRAHQRRREARWYVLDSICPVWSRPRFIQHLEMGAKRCTLAWKYGGLHRSKRQKGKNHSGLISDIQRGALCLTTCLVRKQNDLDTSNRQYPIVSVMNQRYQLCHRST